MKWFQLIVICIAGSVLTALGLLFLSSNPLTFESLESLTETGSPVFNQVSWVPGWKRDIWLMKQSHRGLDLKREDWDRLAIVVDKTRRPYEAKFYQLAKGGSDSLDLSRTAPYGARCFACHSSGPRTIRPAFKNDDPDWTWKKQIQITLWNLRIKAYGPVISVAGQDEQAEGAPFKSRMPVMSKPLALKSCVGCHADHGIRRPLTHEHIGTAKFMVKKGFMPPFPFKVHLEDLTVLKSYR